MANIIFDFDGTIADSFGAAVHIYEQLLRDGKPMPADEVERLRGMSMMHAAVELRIKPWKAPFLLAKAKRMMRKRIDTVEVFAGMPEVIKKLRADGHQLYVMSSNSVQNIKPVLKRYDLRTDFIKLYGNAGLFGKANLLKSGMRRQKLKPDETFYVGDEVRDITAAQKAGIRIIAVTWGYNNKQALVSHDPDFMALKPQDIIKIVEA